MAGVWERGPQNISGQHLIKGSSLCLHYVNNAVYSERLFSFREPAILVYARPKVPLGPHPLPSANVLSWDEKHYSHVAAFFTAGGKVCSVGPLRGKVRAQESLHKGSPRFCLPYPYYVAILLLSSEQGNKSGPCNKSKHNYRLSPEPFWWVSERGDP